MSSYLDINNFNNVQYPQKKINFRGTLTDPTGVVQKPIEKVENIVNNTVDTFVKEPEDEEKKKSHKAAITAGSTVLVLGIIGAFLNPSFSSKFLGRLRTWSSKAAVNAEKNKNSFLTSKFYKFLEKNFKALDKVFQFTNSMNGSKDIGFKWLCCAEKFKGVKNEGLRNFLQKCDGGIRKVTSYTHNAITRGFDALGKKTVFRNYKSAYKNMASFEEFILTYKKKLSPKDQKLLEEKLAEIYKSKEFFLRNNVAERLTQQEQAMANLENDFRDKCVNGFFKQLKLKDMKHNYNLIKNNMTYWAEDMLVPTKNKVEKQGKDAVDVLFGDGKDVRGKYNEILDLISPYMKKEEKAVVKKTVKNLEKNVRKANKSECLEYFDKKRDLMLGGAPTDIVTNAGLLGLSGIAIGTADNRDERISRILTLGFPAIAGIGTSMALTSMLFSGTQGMLLGSGAGLIMSRIGSAADKAFNKKINNNESEVMNA